MKKEVLLFFPIYFLLISMVFAWNSIRVEQEAVDGGIKNQMFNFSVDAGSEDIIELNITLPSEFSFVSGTNGTDSDFDFNVESGKLIWKNKTSEGFNETKYFWFNAHVPKESGYYNFNVTTLNRTLSINSTNISIFVEKNVWSTREEFYLKPIEIFLNWKNEYREEIKLTVNASLPYQTKLSISNFTTGISGNYSQRTNYPYVSEYLKYWVNCFYYNSIFDNPLMVKNSSGEFTNTTNLMNAGSSENFTLIYYSTCPPGRYWGRMKIINTTNPGEYANITVTIDVPINKENVLNNGIGIFKGTLPANYSTYHSYFFNTSDIKTVENATGVTINLTWNNLNNDLDIFLVDEEGNLKSKSISKSGFERLQFNYLPVGKMWEVRVYGSINTNDNYIGTIYFTTLNITNSSSPDQQISFINFGTMGVGSKNTVNIKIENEGNLTFPNIKEFREIYRIDRFTESKHKNFTFIVPEFVTKIRAELNWTGPTNYTLNIYNPEDELIETSTNKKNNANISKVMQEEFVESTNINEGFWKVEVKNNTPSENPFTLTLKLWMDEDEWISSSYGSEGRYFNRSGQPNSSYEFHFNITVPKNTMSGKYEGFLKYSGSSEISLPFELNVSAPTIIINNSFKKGIIQIDDNIGFNRIGENAHTLNISINNTGNENLEFDDVKSSISLKRIGGGEYINFSYEYPSTIEANSSKILNITIEINTTKTNNREGVYEGWIYFNCSSSYPYQYFNLSLRVNLSRILIVEIPYINTSDGSNIKRNSTRDENITIVAIVKYLNGTEIRGGISDPTPLTIKNFTMVYLLEGNTSYRIPVNAEQYLNIYNGSSLDQVWNPSGYYQINATIPGNHPGGQYRIHITTIHHINNITFEGIGNYHPFVINNTGLYMSSTSSLNIEMENGTSYVFYVNVSNYGVLSSRTTIAFIENCPGYSVENGAVPGGSCGGLTSYTGNKSFSISPPGYNTSCVVWWEIRAGATAADACTGNIVGDSSTDKWFNPRGINVTVTVSAPSPEVPIIPPPNITPPKYVANLAFIKAEKLIIVQQNSSNSTIVTVNNTGNISQTINFTIENINSSWYSLNSSWATLGVGKTASFLINFKVGEANIGEYSGNYKAYSPNKTITYSFTLKVVPSPETKENIKKILENYKNESLTLEEDINKSKEEGKNTTAAESKLSELKSKIRDAEDYLRSEDYISAKHLFSDIESLIDSIKEELIKASKEEKKEEKGGFQLPIFYVLIAVVLIIIGFVAYLFWPVSIKKTEKKIAPTKEEEIWEELKKKWSKIRGKK